MKKKRFILCICCLLLAALRLSVWAENVPTTDDKWEGDFDRSLSSSPTIYEEGNTLFIDSGKNLDGLYIAILTTDRCVVYEETTTVLADIEYPVSIEALPQGAYYIVLMRGSSYLYGLFTKE